MSGCCHCRLIFNHVVSGVLRRIRPVHYLTEALQHGAARSRHQLNCDSWLVVVLKSIERVAAGLVPRVATDHSAR